ncbi:MAG TPA: hypothetical protein VM600_05720 [Actinomycetota bacterium]|nr:hypothetical protein [Actinomycetota bacterium]
MLVLVVAVLAPNAGKADAGANGFVDRFDRTGPLAGSRPSDPWEVKSGDWRIIDQAFVDTPPGASESNRILVQNSKAITPLEPIAFVRARSFRCLAVQVSAAMLDPLNPFGDVVNSASVGVVFRAPITDGVADKDNLYLFSSIVTGVTTGFPTGKAYALFKRVGRGYFLLNTQTVNTWADFTKPHDYKVVMCNGRIQAFVDGRLVIDHVDQALGDNPTPQDPLPGLPFDQGAVGLRTSGTRAWFDNFVVVGNDAYEGRASVVDGFTDYGISGSGPQGQIRRGIAVQLTRDLERLSANALDTKFQYHDHDFEEAVLSPLENPTGGQPSIGASLSTFAKNGKTTSRAKLVGTTIALTDPTKRVQVSLQADSVEIAASAECNRTETSLAVVNGTLTVKLMGAGNTEFSIPLKHNYPPNTVIYDRPTLITVIAHYTSATTTPSRVEMSALKIVIPNGGGLIVPSQGVPYPNPPVALPRTPQVDIVAPPFEATVANVVAGRYCN